MESEIEGDTLDRNEQTYGHENIETIECIF